jgi:nucleoside-diphosphate-sugar epimerase
MSDVDGAIHLAAVSRVIWGERDPDGCWSTNVGGTRNVLEAARRAPRAPWVIFASSREVYGEPEALPATEDAPLRPVNMYGRTKVEGERLVEVARDAGLRACTVRLSNVFGSVSDHADRVVPAFVRAALLDGELRIDGAEHTFDFTHTDDVARGIVRLADLLASGAPLLPPIHFVTGRPTTLGELARLVVQLAGTSATLRAALPRNFDVARFYGDSKRARRLLDWHPQVDLRDGLARLISAFRATLAFEAAS